MMFDMHVYMKMVRYSEVKVGQVFVACQNYKPHNLTFFKRCPVFNGKNCEQLNDKGEFIRHDTFDDILDKVYIEGQPNR